MDLCRHPYTAMIRPYYDSDQQVEVRWYQAHPRAQLLTVPNRFGSATWNDHADVFPLGEVFSIDRDWTNLGNTQGNLGLAPCALPDAWYRGVSINQPALDCVCRREPVLPIQEVPGGLINGVNRVFNLSQTPISNTSVLLMVNGLVQQQGADYSLNFGQIRFNGGSQPRADSSLLAYYWIATP